MVELLPRHHAALRFAVADALKGVSESAVLRYAVERTIALVLATVHSAIADVAQTWNNQNRDPLRRLPLELHVSCLQWLRVDELLVVSHVSRDWRAAACSEPRLWSSYEVGPETKASDRRAVLLRTALQRSLPLPFTFIWEKKAPITNAIMDVLAAPETAARLRTIAALPPNAGSISHVLDRPLPLLHTLMARGDVYGSAVQLPASWSKETVPNLRFVMQGSLLVPSTVQPLVSVTRVVLPMVVDCLHLFDLFPCAEYVRLGVRRPSTPLPRKLGKSVTGLHVGGVHLGKYDLSGYLFDLDWHLVPTMYIESSTVARPLAWFSNQVAGNWQLFIDDSDDLVLHDKNNDLIMITMTTNDRRPDDRRTYTMQVTIPFNVLDYPTPVIEAHNLTIITIGDHTMLPALLFLPLESLQSLTIRLPYYGTSAVERVLHWIQSCTEPLSMPVLQHIRFEFSPNSEYVAKEVLELVKAVPQMVALRTRRLESINLIGRGLFVLKDCDFIFDFCDSLRLEDGDKAQVYYP
ncbi:hypothetical protein EXIGLDRAFT_837326 [Exidia glandulosa HHB12029]|uniref:F-box domain-containing protein n=1 Tax=Exidia glandulosa HHB12029 TaxID=1314781 RepID=A0A165GWT8_EXIGL|nr:hypothetical protein EXIGLDRAFT_837326 [Exidia glandulosa HHB12029]